VPNPPDWHIATSRIRIRLTLDLSRMKHIALRGIARHGDIYRAFYIASSVAAHTGGAAMPLRFSPPVIAYWSSNNIVGMLEERLKRARLNIGIEPIDRVQPELGAIAVAAKALVLSMVREGFIRNGFRVVYEHRAREQEGLLPYPALVGKFEGKRIEPRFSLYVRKTGLNDKILDVEVDLALDYGTIKRESIAGVEPGVYTGIFYYYGPLRTRGSTPIVITLNTSVKDFILNNGMLLYDYYRLHGDEYTPEPEEKTAIVISYKPRLPHRMQREYGLLETLLTETCAQGLKEIRTKLANCLAEAAAYSLKDSNSVETIVHNCMSAICGEGYADISNRLRLLAYPASNIRRRIKEEDNDSTASFDEHVRVLERLAAMTLGFLKDMLSSLKDSGIVKQYSVERVVLKPGSGSTAFTGIKILNPVFYNRAAQEGVYPPDNILHQLFGATRPLDYCIRLMSTPDGKHVCTRLSPSAALKRRLAPLPGPRNVSLIVFYSARIGDDTVSKAIDIIASTYEQLNLGRVNVLDIKPVPSEPHRYVDGVKAYLKKTTETLKTQEEKHVLCIGERSHIIYYGCKGETAKQLKGVHASIIKPETIRAIVQRHRLGIQENIALAIYKEVLIQDAKKPNGLLATPWTLCAPADGEGRTLYLGLDVGRAESPKANPAICTALYDSYGSMLGADVFAKTRGEKLDASDIRKAIESAYELVSNIKPPLKNKPTRIVVLRDGIPYMNELIEEEQRLNNITVNVTVVGVAKMHNTRIYIKTADNRAYNPPPVTTYYLGTYHHVERGYTAHHVLLATSHSLQTAGGKAPLYRPLLLIIPEKYVKTPEEAINLALEVGRLNKLNFENATSATNRLPLPLLIADTLSRLVANGLPEDALRIRARRRIPVEREEPDTQKCKIVAKATSSRTRRHPVENTYKRRRRFRGKRARYVKDHNWT